MVKIKLKRLGAPHKPCFRIVVQDSHKSPVSRYIDLLGTYQPLEKDANDKVQIDEAKTIDWLKKGAQPTDKTLALLKHTKIWSKFVESKHDKEENQ
ncbi:MAG: 30S ribosomal protein S16 [Caldisericia bacterium]|nr:30S ribosomal protein S16 [Caldisericia bacterium]MDD4613901.1 30S ribosomal protein S16 [Caldisericia bacterium]